MVRVSHMAILAHPAWDYWVASFTDIMLTNIFNIFKKPVLYARLFFKFNSSAYQPVVSRAYPIYPHPSIYSCYSKRNFRNSCKCRHYFIKQEPFKTNYFHHILPFILAVRPKSSMINNQNGSGK